jgi:hypothetical protein
VLWWTENIVMGCNALTMTVMPMDVFRSRFPPSPFHAPFGQRSYTFFFPSSEQSAEDQ